MIYWMVEIGNAHVIVSGLDRNSAKRSAYSILGGDPDNYIVTPLTERGDRFWINLPIAV